MYKVLVTMNNSKTSLTLNNQKLQYVNLKKGLNVMNDLGAPTSAAPPQNVMPSDLYKPKFTRMNNQIPLGCPSGWKAVVDTTPFASGKGILDFDGGLATGLPICQNDGSSEKCYTSAVVSLMGEDMFTDRKIKKCDDETVKYQDNEDKYPSACDNIEDAEKACEAGGVNCRGFVRAAQSDADGKVNNYCTYIKKGINRYRRPTEKSLGEMYDMGDVQLVGGVKLQTHLKNKYDYTPIVGDMDNAVTADDIGRGVETFAMEGVNVDKNIGLLIVVLFMVVLFYMKILSS